MLNAYQPVCSVLCIFFTFLAKGPYDLLLFCHIKYPPCISSLSEPGSRVDSLSATSLPFIHPYFILPFLIPHAARYCECYNKRPV
ncbi:hypothetical protein BDF20DRAFT_842806 [Mycotypha africana]|uniref:uncharacterized protein n=1 Tax=Mycotypha africana TaxID=64632 RepID=UPI0023004AF1|nr:uncharacterized protein BDF20DRAFT_842806 [Mycotypha africana]KAI8991125.1 hypothetical protein BDF20DRAFT_842806 [Mycotypha africana]